LAVKVRILYIYPGKLTARLLFFRFFGFFLREKIKTAVHSYQKEKETLLPHQHKGENIIVVCTLPEGVL